MPTSFITRLARLTIQFFFMLMIFVLLLELLLRLYPVAIPIKLLRDFEPRLRHQIAQQLGLPMLSERRFFKRDDGGRDLSYYKPFAAILHKQKDPEIVPPHPADELGFCNPPNTYRDHKIIDIIAIGDSFTFCTGVPNDQSWPILLGQRLNRSSYNLAISGTAPLAYLQYLKQFGLAKQPRFVIMNIYEGNDLAETLADQELIAGIKAHKLSAQHQSVPVGFLGHQFFKLRDSVIGQYSYAVNLLATGARRFYKVTSAKRDQRGSSEAEINFRYRAVYPDAAINFNQDNTDISEVETARQVQSGTISFSAFDTALTNFVDLSKQYHFIPVVSYSPSAYSAYAGLVQFDDPELAQLMPAFSTKQRQYLTQQATRLGFHFIDLTPALQLAAINAGPRQLLYFPYIVHYTRYGHQVVAATLAKALTHLSSQTTDTIPAVNHAGPH